MTIGGTDLLAIIDKGGAIAALVIILVAIMRGWLVPGHVYRDCISDRDFWREAALTTTNAAERAVGLAERRRRFPERDGSGDT